MHVRRYAHYGNVHLHRKSWGPAQSEISCCSTLLACGSCLLLFPGNRVGWRCCKCGKEQGTERDPVSGWRKWEKERDKQRRETADLLSGKARECAVAVSVASCCQCRKCNFRCNSSKRSGKRACRVNNAALCTYILLSIYSVGNKCKRVWVQREPAAKTTEKRSKKKKQEEKQSTKFSAKYATLLKIALLIMLCLMKGAPFSPPDLVCPLPSSFRLPLESSLLACSQIENKLNCNNVLKSEKKHLQPLSF